MVLVFVSLISIREKPEIYENLRLLFIKLSLIIIGIFSIFIVNTLYDLVPIFIVVSVELDTFKLQVTFGYCLAQHLFSLVGIGNKPVLSRASYYVAILYITFLILCFLNATDFITRSFIIR